MAIICPTVTATEPHQFRQQLERVASFAERIHIDLADGVFTDNKLLPLDDVWWPAGAFVDVHLMYEAVKPFLAQLVALKPHMVIIHAEAVGNYYSVAKPLKAVGIKVGVALLAHTPVTRIKQALPDIDHVLVFSGHLGYFGGKADLELLKKVEQLKKLHHEIEIGWDGGINEANAAILAQGGVDVLNVGGAIQRATDPKDAYGRLKALVS
ncbi:MAG TPA: hypothetical protein PKA02_04470 [Candidatus Saccharibacteria bacterium]|nr:hypothetical protein [Candidatus Saccharibacteria bacterium]